MSTQGPLFAGTVTTDNSVEGANDWLNPTNIQADDTAEAQITAATFDSPDLSYRLLASNFGFTLPAGSTVTNIQVDINRRSIIASSGKDSRVELLDTAGALVGTNKADTVTVWPTTLTTATYSGAPGAYWGWAAGTTETEINDPDWGVCLTALANIANADIAVEWISITVTYTGPPVISSATMADADRDWDTPYQDVAITFDVAMEKSGGTPYNVGDTIPGLTIGPSGSEGAVTYRSGDSTTGWVVRRAALAKNGDTWVIDYARSTGELVTDGGGAELSDTANAAVTNNLTKRVRFIAKDAAGSAITTACSMNVVRAHNTPGSGTRDLDNTGWGVQDQRAHVTPSGAGLVDVQYNGPLAVGDYIYVALFNPREDLTGSAEQATIAFIWPQLVV